MMLAGDLIEDVNERGEPLVGDTLLVLLNGHDEKVPFILPDLGDPRHQWLRVMDTMAPRTAERAFRPASRYPLQGRSVAMFKMTPPIRERRRSLHSLIQREPVEAAEPAPVVAKS
jgi:isoamylase